MPRTSLLLATWLLLLPSVAFSQRAPEGWRTQRRGKAIVSSPRDLKPGEVFVVRLEPDIDLRGEDLRDWFRRAIEAKEAKLGGKRVGDRAIEKHGTGLSALRTYKGPDGSMLMASFSIGVQPDGRYLLANVFCTPAACRAHRESVAKWLQTMADAGASSATAARPAPRSAERPPYQTDPGRGIKPSQIEKVVAEIGAFQSWPVLLLKNGEYCSEIILPPGDMDESAHKAKFPAAWGKWRRQGGRYQQLGSRGQWVDATWQGTLTPAHSGDELDGWFHSSSGSFTMGDSVMVDTSDITFLPGHRFRTSAVSGGTVGGDLSDTGSATYSNVRKADGTYRFDGDAIELRNADGAVERRAFYWVGSQKSGFFMNRRYFYREQRKR